MENKKMENSFIEEAVASAELTEAFEPPKEDDLSALNQLVEEYTGKETELAKVESELVTRDEQFANFITTQKRLKEQKEVLTDLIREELEKRDLSEYETKSVKLRLTSSGKYKLEDGVDINSVDDSLCKVVKSLDNKKITAYRALNGSLPDGVKDTNKVLRIIVKD